MSENPGDGRLSNRDCQSDENYQLDQQVGFLLRRANQRHLSIFSTHIGEFTPMQFAALAKLCELGAASQNDLGRRTAMDAATIMGVIERLKKRELVEVGRDPNDQRRVLLTPTPLGQKTYNSLVEAAKRVTNETLSPLTAYEQAKFLSFLERLTDQGS